MNVIRWKVDIIGNIGDTGQATVLDANPFDDGAGIGSAASAAGVAETERPKLTTLVGFTGADGSDPMGSLSTDAAGDLFGTTYYGGADRDGTVFEIARTRGGYARRPPPS